MKKVLSRKTIQKQIIIDEINSRCDHPTAEQVYLSIHEKHPKISKATVYRNLSELYKKGEIIKIDGVMSSNYDFKTTPHYHFRCEKCNKVYDIDLKYMEGLEKQAKSNHLVLKHDIVFSGICEKCK